MDEERSKVLSGCHLVFSRIIPMEQDPRTHALWRMAEQFGATCALQCSEATTHVVATTRGTEKVGEGRGLSVGVGVVELAARVAWQQARRQGVRRRRLTQEEGSG